LTSLEPEIARWSLGVRSAPDGNNEEQVEYLWGLAEDWREKIQMGHLSKHDAWMALTTRIMHTMEYPLPALTLTKAQCMYIMAPILTGGLNAIGLCKYLPRIVVYAPIKFQGLGLKFPYTTMGIDHMKMIMEEGQRNFHMGKKFWISLEALKVEVGVGGCILVQSFSRYGVLATDSLVKHTWQFLHKYQMSIEEQVGELWCQREYDTFLIEALHQGGKRGKALQHLNCCRLFLQVMMLSDIITGNGRYISYAARHGQKDPT